MTENQIIILDAPELTAIEKSKAEQIRATFQPMAEMLKTFENEFSDIIKESRKGIDKALTSKAKRLRIDIAEVRSRTEDVRKEQKEEYLRAGKAIDGVSNILKWAVSEKENKLKEIENYFEIKEQKRLEELQKKRSELIAEYLREGEPASDYTKFTEEEFNALLEIKEKQKTERIEAEKKAKEEREKREAEERTERELLELENARLKEEKEKAETVVREQAQKIKKQEDKERTQRDAENQKRQSELNKGDKEKVKDLIKDLAEIKNKYTFASDENKKMYESARILIDKIIFFIQK